MLLSRMFVSEITLLEKNRLIYVDSKFLWVKMSNTRLDSRIDHLRLVDHD